MANDSFKVKKSLNIEPVASASPTAKGDIVYDSTSDTVKYYNGSSRTVVNTDETQSLSNKTLASPTFSGTITSGLTASRALATGASGELAASSVTSTELGYVSGVTSAIQTQLGDKVASTSGTLTSPTVTNEITQAHTATPSAPASGYMKIYPKSDGKYYTLDSSSVETQLGSGGSGKNYLQSVFDGASVTGFTAYADAAASVPVDMTGGSPDADLTFAASASSPLTGTSSILFTHTANNRQGSGWSTTISLDVSDRGKVLAFSMNYAVASGTYASGDLIFYAYDVTNSVLIQSTPYSILNHTLGSERFFAELQTSSSTASLRIGFHVATSTATAYTMKMDDMVFGPQAKLYGSVATDWLSYTPTTVQGFGTTSSSEYYWRRVGMEMQVRGRFTAGTVAASEARISLPTGYTSASAGSGIDTTNNVVGFMTASGGLAYTINTLIAPGSTYFQFGKQSTQGLTAQNGDALVATGAEVSFFGSAPISGWSSSQLLSDQADTRVIALIASGSAASASSGNPIIFPTITKDSHAAYNNSTGRYTAPISGWYQVTAGGAVTAGTAARLQIYLDASLYAIIGFVNSTDGLMAASGMVYANAGQIIDLRPNATVAGMNSSSSFCIQRVSGPAQIAASEKPFSEVRYSQSGSTTAGWGSTNTKIRIYTTSEKSTGSDITYASSSTAGSSFTINTTGCYEISFGDSAASGAMQIGVSVNASSLTTNLNSLTYAQGKRAYSNPTGQYHGSITLYLTAGDIVRGHGDTTSAITTNNVYLHIKRIF